MRRIPRAGRSEGLSGLVLRSIQTGASAAIYIPGPHSLEWTPERAARSWSGTEHIPVDGKRMTNAKLMIVGDAAYLEEPLRGLGYTVCARVPFSWRAIEEAAGTDPDLALVDIGFEDGADGLEAADRIGSRLGTPVVLLADGAVETGQGLFKRAWTAFPLGCVLKPFEERQLHWNIQAALAQHGRERGHREAERGLEDAVTELQDRIELMQAVLDSMKEGVFANDETGRRLFANASALDVGGTDEPPRLAEWSERYGIYFPDGETLLPMEQSPLLHAFQGKTTEWAEFFVRNARRPEGIHVGISARPLVTTANGLKAGVVVFQDITESKAAQARLKETLNRLQEQNELLAATFNNIRDGVIVSDSSGRYLYANPAAQEMLGDAYVARKDGLWLEKPEGYYYYPDRETPIRNKDLPLSRAVFDQEPTDDMEIFVPLGDAGQGSFLRVSGRPLFDNEGGTRGGVITIHEVGREALADEALMRAYQQGRLEVVDTILHNIGNAITSVATGIDTVHRRNMDNRLIRELSAIAELIGDHREDWADYIENDPQGRQAIPALTALARKFVAQNTRVKTTIARVRDRAQYIVDIIRNHQESAIVRPSQTEVNVRHSITKAVRLMQDPNRKQRTRIEIDCNRVHTLYGIDDSRFQQMMLNLLKNAMEAIDKLAVSGGLKEEPRISVRVRFNTDFLDIVISDNGVGTAEKDTRKLFVAGYTTKEKGGLGLHSAANFVIGMGGKISLQSDGIGKGATVQVRLPPPPAAQVGEGDEREDFRTR